MHKYIVTLIKGNDNIKIFETTDENIAIELADDICRIAKKADQVWEWKRHDFTGRTAISIERII